MEKKKKLIIPQKELIVCDPLVIYVIPYRSNYFLEKDLFIIFLFQGIFLGVKWLIAKCVV